MDKKTFEKIEKVLSEEPKLIEIKKPTFHTQAKKIIFVGDTHGDLEVSKKVVKDYLKPGNIIVFLGDYVDRGPFSRENLDFLLETKIKNPEKIYILQGNHEGHRILPFSPADFWQNLNKEEYQIYTSVVERFPLIAITKDIIALHGVLPDLKITRPGLAKEINKIKLGSQEWEQIVWGDFVDQEGEYLGTDTFTGRSQFGRDYFSKLMGRFNKKVLIRAHQPAAPQYMFDDRCLTIFTSSAYPRERTIAILDFEEEIKTAKDLELIKI